MNVYFNSLKLILMDPIDNISIGLDKVWRQIDS